MKISSHGADIFSASKESGIDENSIIDFSSNINPLGIHNNVRKAMINSIEYADRYPDIDCNKLINRLSIQEQVPREWIFCSNGAAEAIFRIVLYLKPHNAILTAPTFSEYEQSLKTVNCKIKYYNLSEDNNFKIKEDILDIIDQKTDIVFICNPNNPTGQLTDKNLLEKIILQCKKINAAVVIDECFIDFIEDKENYSVQDILKQYDNLIILKAFTKVYSIPGIRLGYCLCPNTTVIKGLKESGPPWNVSVIAQEAGIAALEEKEYVVKTIEYIKKERNYLINELNKYNIKIFDSYANYIFFKLECDEIDLKSEMLKRGILIRSCSNYRNISNEYYRIAVKKEHENKIFIEKLKDILVEK
ncbi:MAG: histidinol-phosphate transaminase [Tissierellia bacterium]|nr:histidinol-phosphate transaminase [Tissierellia bacterium]MDD4781562.1 histidinol-phosphate transaminase [Tissierellia bacterium]